MNERAIQLAVALKFDWFRNLIVPNAYLGSWEMDMAVLTPSKYLWEVEIKISLSDWKADLKKGKWDRYENPFYLGPETRFPSRFYYCVPGDLLKGGVPAWVPAKAGVLAVRRTNTSSLEIEAVRAPKRLHAHKLDEKLAHDLYRKTYVRMWLCYLGKKDAQKEAELSL